VAHPSAVPEHLPSLRWWVRFLSVAGPGIVVMLADTDVGSIVTAAQSGASWGYRLLLLQILLVPILFVVQDLTVRLGLVTGKGHGELIREHFGPGWAWASVSSLVVACAGALLTEFVGVVAVGQFVGVPAWASLALAAGFLLVVVWTGSYRRVELVAILLGAFELAFIWLAVAAHPDGRAVATGLSHLPIRDHAYLYLVAANIGAVLMPWMVFYQQSAVVDKGLGPEHLHYARWDTAVGTIVTQIMMAAILITVAATIGTTHPGTSLGSVEEIANALTPFLGSGTAHVLLGLGILGAAMVASVVVTLAAAWGVGEVAGYRHSLDQGPRAAPWFYGLFSLVVVTTAVVVGFVKDLVSLTIGVQVMNALLLPLVLGLLFQLARRALPPPYRPRGAYAAVVGSLILVVSVLGVFGGLGGILRIV